LKIEEQTVAKPVQIWYHATNHQKEAVIMLFLVLGVGIFVLSILFQLASLLRLSVPLAYALIVPTLFHSWYYAHYLCAMLAPSPPWAADGFGPADGGAISPCGRTDRNLITGEIFSFKKKSRASAAAAPHKRSGCQQDTLTWRKIRAGCLM
jgi:hypothetical protein